MADSVAEPKRFNILILDGGGVRGLSSLLILQALMFEINQSLLYFDASINVLHPHHVFQLVAGTSTGGLIALMLGKMGMTTEECIEQYEKLSKIVFGKKHMRARVTFGLAPARYSGNRLQKCIRDLLQARRLDEDLMMSHSPDSVACAVVCREHCSSSQYSKLKNTAVPICSLPCKDNIICKVCDAARATSAAPTFFSAINIKGRFFVDGGLQYNNPSFAIYYHYTRMESKKSTRRVSPCTSAPQFSPHGDLDCSCVRITNIGTGAKVDEVEPGKRDRLANMIPGVGALRQAMFLKRTLADIAVNSEQSAEMMRRFEEMRPEFINYERFDASHGVSSIRLDNHNALGDIRRKTELYLGEQDTKEMLKEVGRAIASDYLSAHPDLRKSSLPATDFVTEEVGQLSRPPTATPISLPPLNDQPNGIQHNEDLPHVRFSEHGTCTNRDSVPSAQHEKNHPFFARSTNTSQLCS